MIKSSWDTLYNYWCHKYICYPGYLFSYSIREFLFRNHTFDAIIKRQNVKIYFYSRYKNDILLIDSVQSNIVIFDSTHSKPEKFENEMWKEISKNKCIMLTRQINLVLIGIYYGYYYTVILTMKYIVLFMFHKYFKFTRNSRNITNYCLINIK